MQSQELVRHFLAELGLAVGERFELDEFGVCTMRYGDGRELTIEAPLGSDSFLLHARVAAEPEADREAFYRQALTLGAFGWETGGCGVGRDEHSGDLVLWRLEPAERWDVKDLEALVLNFSQTVEQVRQRLAEGSTESRDELGVDPLATISDFRLRV